VAVRAFLSRLGATLAVLLVSSAHGATPGEMTPGRAAESVAGIVRATSWGESSAGLARAFGARATRLARPIEFGDSYADIVLRHATLRGYRFVVYFQMDKTSRGLKRIQFERPRHGVNPPAFRAALAALEAEYGPPAERCNSRAGGQVAAQWLWRPDGNLVRATRRDTTLEASEGCLFGDPSVVGACGLTGQLFIRVSPSGEASESCR
jgi:hypothetical protein